MELYIFTLSNQLDIYVIEYLYNTLFFGSQPVDNQGVRVCNYKKCRLNGLNPGHL